MVITLLKLMIVDDEQLILEGLKVIVEWEELGVTIIGTANNGKEALEFVVNHEVDIVMTDIRMPEMNGLELIKNIREKRPDIRCILLTGYQEFEYAREALRYGAAAYLLKPIDEDELCELIKDIGKNYEKNKISSLKQELMKNDIYNIPYEIERRLVNCIICGDSVNIPEIINEIFKEFSNLNIELERFLLVLRDILALIRRNVTEMGYDISEFNDEIKTFFEKSYFIDDMKDIIIIILVNLCKNISALNLSGCKAFILKVKQYIDENYCEQLTLNMISDKFYIHTSYFSRLFKKETGENFIDYLTKKRIDESKKLLLGTRLKIYEISERVGYKNSKYFSQLFEKYIGVTPKEYRNIKNKYSNFL